MLQPHTCSPSTHPTHAPPWRPRLMTTPQACSPPLGKQDQAHPLPSEALHTSFGTLLHRTYRVGLFCHQQREVAFSSISPGPHVHIEMGRLPISVERGGLRRERIILGDATPPSPQRLWVCAGKSVKLQGFSANMRQDTSLLKQGPSYAANPSATGPYLTAVLWLFNKKGWFCLYRLEQTVF